MLEVEDITLSKKAVLLAFLQAFEAFVFCLAVFFLARTSLVRIQAKQLFFSSVPSLAWARAPWWQGLQVLGFVVGVMVCSAVLLLVFRFFSRFARWFFAFFGFFTTLPLFLACFPWQVAFLLALLVGFAIKAEWFSGLSINAISLLFAASGAFLLVLSFSPLFLLFLALALSLYDMFSVFFSKHMVALAKGVVSQRLPLVFYGWVPGRAFLLGLGDVIFLVGFWLHLSSLHLYAAMAVGFFTFFLLFLYTTAYNRALPALPPIVLGEGILLLHALFA